jgi:hypothetical protein
MSLVTLYVNYLLYSDDNNNNFPELVHPDIIIFY